MSDNSQPQFVLADVVERRNAMRGSKMEETIIVNTVNEEGEYIKIREFESIVPEEKRGCPTTDKVIKSTENS